MEVGAVLDNRTICDHFGVASIGGIRVNRSRNLIVLISNNTNATYKNEWKDDVLHFVGMGSVGPQKLARQNRTLSGSTRNGTALHLFEVFEKSRYVYAGEVELADEPYMSDQLDARAEGRFVWIFPLRRKHCDRSLEAATVDKGTSTSIDHLPYGAYAVIGSDLRDDQLELVKSVIDQLKLSGAHVFDKRDVDQQRYDRALARWHEDVLGQARSIVRDLITKKKRSSSVNNRPTSVDDDELKINSMSSERELREALRFLDRDDSVDAEEVFELARQRVPMPEPPASLLAGRTSDPIEEMAQPNKKVKDRTKFDGFT